MAAAAMQSQRTALTASCSRQCAVPVRQAAAVSRRQVQARAAEVSEVFVAIIIHPLSLAASGPQSRASSIVVAGACSRQLSGSIALSRCNWCSQHSENNSKRQQQQQ